MCDEAPFDLVAEIQAAFAFLGTDYGFRIAHVETKWPNWVEYRSNNVSVIVSDERMHYDLTVTVGQNEPQHRSGYSLQEILEAADAPVARELWSFQTSSDEVAKRFLSRMAEYLKAYGKPALTGDTTFFKKMEARSRERSEEHNKRDQLEWTRRQAKEAWERKDYTKAADLYGSIRANLSPAEDKKRLYSLRKISEAEQS